MLVHCAASKDRTGVSVALMLTPIGIDRAEVVTDDVATVAITGGKR
ncbi:MAG: tyrosine-protein phosphatase [Demequina sp.]|nr:tyrosine-protein phosphatase [Demequina sp.]